MRRKKLAIVALSGFAFALLTFSGCISGRCKDKGAWWKGVTHVHSTWSDGTSYPEVVAQWYKSHGYNFMVVTDHNTVQAGEKWKPARKENEKAAVGAYRNAFGAGWVEERGEGSNHQVRCRQLSEYRERIEDSGKFILVRGEEITSKKEKQQVHVVAVNVADNIAPKVGKDVVDTLAANIDSVSAQAKEKNLGMIAILCHPNWGNGPSVEEVWPSNRVKFFEVVNGLPYNIWNLGDKDMLSTDRFLDVALTKRLESGSKVPLFAVAADDMHRLDLEGGYSWIMVRATELKPRKIVEAMERGDFYASTGVTLKDFGMRDGKLFLEIQPENGVTYVTQFIGTRGDYDKRNECKKDEHGMLLPPAQRYSQDIGKVLAECKGATVSCTPSGDELYIRAKVISSKMITGPKGEKAWQSAWIHAVPVAELRGSNRLDSCR